MNIEELQARLDKKKAQREKLEKKIEKLEAKKNEEAFVKEHAPYITSKKIKTRDEFIQARKAFDPDGDAEAWFDTFYKEYIEELNRDIKYVNKEINDADVIINDYQQKIDTINQKSNATKIQVFVDLLDRWGNEMREYIEDNVLLLNQYFIERNQFFDFMNSKWSTNLSDEEWKAKQKEMKAHMEAIKAQISPVTMSVYDKEAADKIDYEKLNKIIEQEKDRKYWTMVGKCEDVVGTITDASNLYIANDGNINGYIYGTNGTAKVETITAGGYNQDIIVNTKHGQVLHFRLLVHRINKIREAVIFYNK